MGTLDDALKRLDGAVGQLEAAVRRRLDVERGRGDLETELQLLQDDRARLALELEGSTARLHRAQAVTDDVGQRVERALGAVREVLVRAGASGRPGGA